MYVWCVYKNPGTCTYIMLCVQLYIFAALMAFRIIWIFHMMGNSSLVANYHCLRLINYEAFTIPMMIIYWKCRCIEVWEKEKSLQFHFKILHSLRQHVLTSTSVTWNIFESLNIIPPDRHHLHPHPDPDLWPDKGRNYCWVFDPPNILFSPPRTPGGSGCCSPCTSRWSAWRWWWGWSSLVLSLQASCY